MDLNKEAEKYIDKLIEENPSESLDKDWLCHIYANGARSKYVVAKIVEAKIETMQEIISTYKLSDEDRVRLKLGIKYFELVLKSLEDEKSTHNG